MVTVERGNEMKNEKERGKKARKDEDIMSFTSDTEREKLPPETPGIHHHGTHKLCELLSLLPSALHISPLPPPHHPPSLQTLSPLLPFSPSSSFAIKHRPEAEGILAKRDSELESE